MTFPVPGHFCDVFQRWWQKGADYRVYPPSIATLICASCSCFSWSVWAALVCMRLISNDASFSYLVFGWLDAAYYFCFLQPIVACAALQGLSVSQDLPLVYCDAFLIIAFVPQLPSCYPLAAVIHSNPSFYPSLPGVFSGFPASFWDWTHWPSWLHSCKDPFLECCPLKSGSGLVPVEATIFPGTFWPGDRETADGYSSWRRASRLCFTSIDG